MYSKVPLSELPDELIVISSHVDCQRQITKCFSKDYDDDLMQGTFDNSLTNAMTVSLMLEDALAMNVVVAFTGDEEEDSTGAADVAAFFQNLHKKIKVIVLDVTDMGGERAVRLLLKIISGLIRQERLFHDFQPNPDIHGDLCHRSV